jgi:hypothetical protein
MQNAATLALADDEYVGVRTDVPRSVSFGKFRPKRVVLNAKSVAIGVAASPSDLQISTRPRRRARP